MKNAVFILLFLLTGFQFATAHIKIQNLLTENRVNPVGIDIANPRFTWQLASEKRNVCQTAYEVTVKLNKNVVWESGKVQSDQSVHVAYAGDRKSTRLNSSHANISYAVFCLKK